MKNRHLLVFTTGLRNFRPEKNWVEKYFKDVADFKVLTVPTTDRGLDVDARELTQKIKEEEATFVSFFGVCVGGLVNRIAIGHCLDERVFEHSVPHIFMTSATPHAGVGPKIEGFTGPVGTFIFRQYINWRIRNQSKIFKDQVWLQDDEKIIHTISQDSHSAFLALKGFRHKVFYAATKHSWLASYESQSVRVDFPGYESSDFEYTCIRYPQGYHIRRPIFCDPTVEMCFSLKNIHIDRYDLLQPWNPRTHEYLASDEPTPEFQNHCCWLLDSLPEDRNVYMQ